MDSITVMTPIGMLGITEDNGAIISIMEAEDTKESNNPLLLKAVKEIEEYFNKERTVFDLPLHFNSSPLYNRVWSELCKVPYGTTISYSELAERAGSNAVRAVATAVGRNNIPIIIPCHRIIRKSGEIGKFSLFGKEAKEYLLKLEGVI